ncbi:MAG: thermonuclease family protein [Synechococcus sp.]|nr:thermonuclease family protein [Synechococcus sp.]
MRRFRSLLPSLIGAGLLAGLDGLSAHAAPATVVSVGDGDTLRVRKAGQTITIRLACIDAPESSQKPHGSQASQALKALLPIGSGIDLRVKTTDRYGRSIAEIRRGGRIINQALVASGAAFVYWQYIRGCDRQTCSRLETEARLKSLGVWSTSGGITRPWDYRRGRRSSGSSRGGSSSGGRLTCKQIGSYAKAQALLRQGHSYLDRDGDGQACEGLR